jgi:ligand-binding sensor domain-containing protein
MAQYPNWKNYTDGGYISDICRQGDLMWIGTLGGLVRINTLTDETTFFNKTNSGIPDNRVSSIAIDSTGKVWVGTYYGIGVYDGTNWVSYDTGNSILPVSAIWELYISPQNDIWIGTFYGYILRISNSVWTLFDDIHNNTPFGTIISSIVADNENNIWAGVSTTPVIGKFDGNSWTIITLPDTCFVQDINVQNDTIWLSADDALLKIIDDSLISADYDDWNVNGFNICKTFIDRDDNFWITSWSGVSCIKPDGSLVIYSDTSSGPLCNKILDIDQDSKGNLWFGTAGRGIAVLDSSGWSYPNTSSSGLNSPTLFQMCFDKNGLLWGMLNPMNFDCPSTTSVTAESYNPSTNEWKTYDEGFTQNRPILVDSHNNKWFIQADSIWIFNDSVWSILHYPMSNGAMIGMDSHYAVVDSNDNIYVARYPGSLLKYSGGSWTSFSAQTVLSNSLVLDFVPWGMCKDKYNFIWMLCNYNYWDPGQQVYMDLVKYDGNGFTNYHIPSNGAMVVSITADKDGYIWIGCGHGTLLKFDGSSFTSYWLGEINSDINRIDADNENNLWISALSGVFRYSISDNVTTKFDYTNSGLPGHYPLAVVFDQYGSKWISTGGYGLGVFNEDSVFYPQPPQDTSANVGSKAPLIFPNPAQERLNIDLSSFTESEIVNVCLSDMMGTIIRSFQLTAGSNLYSIDISDLNSGIYFPVFTSSSSERSTKIVIL